MSATIYNFPYQDRSSRILAQQETDDLDYVIQEQGLELHERLAGLELKDHDSAITLTVHDYHLLASTLLMQMLSSEHRIAVLEQRIQQLDDAVFGGEE